MEKKKLNKTYLKRYFIGSSISEILVYGLGFIFLPLCAMIILPIVSIANHIAFWWGYEIILLLFAVYGGIEVYIHFKARQYKKFALEGKKTIGIVKDLTESEIFRKKIRLDVLYKNEKGEAICFYTYISIELAYFFEPEMSIDIFVNGDYAYFDEKKYYINVPKSYSETSKELSALLDRKIEEAKNQNNRENTNQELNEIKNGSDELDCILDGNENQFKYCPKCGAKLDIDDAFCKKCGKKQ